MPVQFPQNDQVPALTFAGYSGLGAGIGSGISSGVQGLLAGIEKRKEEQKRLAQAGKAADAFYKALPEDQLPIPPEDWALLSPMDKASAMQGIIGASQYKRGVADTQRFLEAAAQSKAEREGLARAPAFMEEVSRYNAPGQLPYNIAPEQFEMYALPEGQARPDVRELTAAAARTKYPLRPEQLDDLLRAMAPKSGTLGLEALKEFGFVPTGGQMNPNSTVSLTFGPPPPPEGPAIPILTDKREPTGKAMFQGKVIDLSPPGAEGKTLTQSETQMLAAFNQAEQDLANLEKMFKGLGPDWGGPISGRVKSTLGMGQNPNIAAIENAITAATPNLARGVFREVGVLTDEDIKRYKALLPTAYDTQAVRKVKMDQLRERITQGRKETMQTLRKAGRDLSGFEENTRDEDIARRIQGVRSAVESTNAPAAAAGPRATPAAKAALANQLRAEHPDWSKARIIEEVNRLLP